MQEQEQQNFFKDIDQINQFLLFCPQNLENMK